jgi:hypothetical protein
MIRGAFQRIVRHFGNSFFDECMQAGSAHRGWRRTSFKTRPVNRPVAADDRRSCEAAFRCDRPYFKAFLSPVFDALDKLVERNCRLIAAP